MTIDTAKLREIWGESVPWSEAKRAIHNLCDELEQARADYAGLDTATRIRINELNAEIDQLYQERERIRADVLKLRTFLANEIRAIDGGRIPYVELESDEDEVRQALADTEHYEQNR